jgi:hypothetical protein
MPSLSQLNTRLSTHPRGPKNGVHYNVTDYLIDPVNCRTGISHMLGLIIGHFLYYPKQVGCNIRNGENDRPNAQNAKCECVQ